MKMRAFSELSLGLLPLCLLTWASDALADSWMLAHEQEIRSTPGFVFRITPEGDESVRLGYCLGELFEVKDGKETKLWARYLVNDISPVDALVSPNGRYVVTMDEWYSMGRLPVVVYGPGGSLKRTHTLESLGVPIREVRSSISSWWWHDNAIIFFSPDDEFLIIRLKSGRTLVLDLGYRNRAVTEEDYIFKEDKEKWSRLQTFIPKEIKAVTLKLLDSKDPRDRQTGSIAAGQLRLAEAVPKLKKLLTDKSYSESTSNFIFWEKTFYVRDAAKQALEDMNKKQNTKESDKKPVNITLEQELREMLEIRKAARQKQFSRIQAAVKRYMEANPEIDKDLRRQLLTIVSAQKPEFFDGGFSVGEWKFSWKKAQLHNVGFRIGGEHTWYEVDLRIDGKDVEVLKVLTKRETIRDK